MLKLFVVNLTKGAFVLSVAALLASCQENSMPRAKNILSHDGKTYTLCPSPKMISYQAAQRGNHWQANGSTWALVNYSSMRDLPELAKDGRLRLYGAELHHNRVLCRYRAKSKSGRTLALQAWLQPHGFAKVTVAGHNWRSCASDKRCTKVCYAVRTDVCPFLVNGSEAQSNLGN